MKRDSKKKRKMGIGDWKGTRNTEESDRFGVEKHRLKESRKEKKLIINAWNANVMASRNKNRGQVSKFWLDPRCRSVIPGRFQRIFKDSLFRG